MECHTEISWGGQNEGGWEAESAKRHWFSTNLSQPPAWAPNATQRRSEMRRQCSNQTKNLWTIYTQPDYLWISSNLKIEYEVMLIITKTKNPQLFQFTIKVIKYECYHRSTLAKVDRLQMLLYKICICWVNMSTLIAVVIIIKYYK